MAEIKSAVRASSYMCTQENVDDFKKSYCCMYRNIDFETLQLGFSAYEFRPKSYVLYPGYLSAYSLHLKSAAEERGSVSVNTAYRTIKITCDAKTYAELCEAGLFNKDISSDA